MPVRKITERGTWNTLEWKTCT